MYRVPLKLIRTYLIRPTAVWFVLSITVLRGSSIRTSKMQERCCSSILASDRLGLFCCLACLCSREFYHQNDCVLLVSDVGNSYELPQLMCDLLCSRTWQKRVDLPLLSMTKLDSQSIQPTLCTTITSHRMTVRNKSI